MTTISSNFEDSIDLLKSRLDSQWIVGTPLGIGKPNPLINHLYQHAKNNRHLSLDIFTALSLEIPHGNSLLERRFLQCFSQRFFGQYPELEYIADVKRNVVPENISVREFYMQSGKMLHSNTAQRSYVSSNYTHVARDMVNREVNVILQMVAVKRTATGNQYSLSCNPDLTLDILRTAERKGKPRPVVIGMVNEHLPFMAGQAAVEASFFDLLHDNSSDYFEPFATPAQPIGLTDYSIGLLASSLIQDGGTLQIGIGSLADAMVYCTQLRQQNNNVYKDLLDETKISSKFNSLIDQTGGTDKFKQGLYAASEMFVEGFAHLYEAGILQRKVYPDAQIQSLLNNNKITERIEAGLIKKLVDWQVIDEVITLRSFERLQHLGVFKTDLTFHKGKITDRAGQVYSSDLHDDDNLDAIEQNCLGDCLKHGAVLHAAFFMGSKRFYQWLHALGDDQKPLFQMTPVSQINELYGGEALDRVQRIKARFINTCMKVDVLGAAASDALDNHQVVSGVGGQYNFVAMAHALEDSRSILMLRSVHASKKTVESNVVWKYGYCTIPRHLRDLVITEYGVADLRGQSDEVCVQRMICIADSRFQEGLRAQAVAHQKLSADWQVPAAFKNNTPEMISQQFKSAQTQGYFPAYPFGEDFTAEEKTIIGALKWLKLNTRNKYATLLTLIKVQFVKASEKEMVYLKMMKLSDGKSFKEKLSAKLLVHALRHL
ncbi:acetyl-CoA hydrolase/transferase C-terminal domain-containing protein [Marinicella litoralis]|uniref:Acetyl-CoA hydrolase/transferase-like protein n=1 Tax=Marinicella litoralis TaxID=644220 RepID=A0A4R6XCC0_9GAMM|nr:acetyl-CoA hydrolase/transferase C-terminal domain-containing protein [Marinicella litoralis]TDR16866.1 acetyl-CoA hydrolase/transferase-like protein [Marinicella litoralis]